MTTWLMISFAVAAGLSAIYVVCCVRKIFAVNADINWALENLHAPNDAFGKSELLLPVWKDFSDSLTKTPDGTFSTVSASEFFSTQNITCGMNMSFWQAYGGIFTGLGILGTFLGLTLGLRGLDMTSGDVEVLKGGIVNLLTGVETAFVTSLVGIACAIIYSGIHHKIITDFQSNVLRLSDKLDEIFPRRPAEEWLAKSFAEQQTQTQEFRKFANEVEAFGTDEIGALGKIFDEQQTQTAELQKLNAGGTEAVGEIVSAGIGKQLETFAATLDKLSKVLEQQAETSAAQHKDDAEKSNRMQETLKHIADSNAAQISEAVKAFREIVDRHNEATEKTFTRIQRLLNNTETFLRAVNDAGNSLETAADNVLKTNGQLLTNLPALSAQMKNLLDANEFTRDNLNDLTEQLTTLVRNFNGIGDEFERSATVIKDSLEHYNSVTNDGLKDKLSTFDKSMGQACAHLRELVEDLSDTLEDFRQNRRR